MAMTPSRYDVAAWVLAACALVAVIELHLLPALLAGLLTFELVHVIAPRLRLGGGGAAKLAAVGVIAIGVAALLTALALGVLAVFRSGHLPTLLQEMADILQQSRERLPAWLISSVPADADAIKDVAIDWLHQNAAELRRVGGEVGTVFVHLLIGIVIGVMVSLHEARPVHGGGPLARALGERVSRLGEAFRRVVFAQVRIAVLNTAFTAIYLLIALPALGIHLPFAKTLVAITFVSGLIPVVGNLISNTVIVVMSLSVSGALAAASLVFLIVVHKLEYFLNARILGAGIHASAWELLLAMLVMEAAFGIPGLVAAPIYYAYLKDELAARSLV